MSWICIDFGTCNTTAAINQQGEPHVVQFGNTPFFPTAACVIPTNNEVCIKVGFDAEQYRGIYPENFLYAFKLNIAEHLDLYGVQYVDIVCEILKQVKEYAEIENNNQEIDSVILTIPAIYTDEDSRKEIMRKSAINAGFHSVEFLSEPRAVAEYYAYIMRGSIGLSLIYDIGGGTFDSALLEMSKKHGVRLLGMEHGTSCGGQFFDALLYKYINKECREKGSPLSVEKKIEDYAACERLKMNLSLENKSADSQCFSNGEIIEIKRETFNRLIKEKVASTLDICDSMLKTAEKNWADIKQILFVGGSTAISLVKTMVENHLNVKNAPNVKIIRNDRGEHGVYNCNFATCMGGIAKKVKGMPSVSASPLPPQIDHQDEERGCLFFLGRVLKALLWCILGIILGILGGILLYICWELRPFREIWEKALATFLFWIGLSFIYGIYSCWKEAYKMIRL